MDSEFTKKQEAIYTCVKTVVEVLDMEYLIEELASCNCSKCRDKLQQMEKFMEAVTYLHILSIKNSFNYRGTTDEELQESFNKGTKYFIQGPNTVN